MPESRFGSGYEISTQTYIEWGRYLLLMPRHYCTTCIMQLTSLWHVILIGTLHQVCSLAMCQALHECLIRNSYFILNINYNYNLLQCFLALCYIIYDCQQTLSNYVHKHTDQERHRADRTSVFLSPDDTHAGWHAASKRRQRHVCSSPLSAGLTIRTDDWRQCVDVFTHHARAWPTVPWILIVLQRHGVTHACLITSSTALATNCN